MKAERSLVLSETFKLTLSVILLCQTISDRSKLLFDDAGLKKLVAESETEIRASFECGKTRSYLSRTISPCVV